MDLSEKLELPIEVLKEHPQNQEYFDILQGSEWERFKKSIEEEGIITPLIVAPDMTIVSGHQRYKAAKEVGLKMVPVIINKALMDEKEKLKKLFAANFGRNKNNPMKMSRVIVEYEKLCDIVHGGARSRNSEKNITQEDIAEELGVSLRTLINLKKLNNLSPEFVELVESGELNYTTAVRLYSKMSIEEQEKFILDVGKDKISELTYKQAEEIIKKRYKDLEEKEKKVDGWYKQVNISADALEEKSHELQKQKELFSKELEISKNKVFDSDEKIRGLRAQLEDAVRRLTKNQEDINKAVSMARKEEKIKAEEEIKTLRFQLNKAINDKHNAEVDKDEVENSLKTIKEAMEDEFEKKLSENSTSYDLVTDIYRICEKGEKEIGATFTVLKSLNKTIVTKGIIDIAIEDRMQAFIDNIHSLLMEVAASYNVNTEGYLYDSADEEKLYQVNKERGEIFKEDCEKEKFNSGVLEIDGANIEISQDFLFRKVQV